ncbi:MAG: GHKL domain-containing protein [Clostridia bacterium]|nr:GHKL domain-containing protein [Clostridia bacterium]
MTILKDISIFWSLAHTLLMFMILFESRYTKKKTNLLTLFTMGPLLVANGIAAIFIPSDIFGTIMLFTLSLPSLIFFIIIAKKRDGRFFFTFCMVDTIVLEVMYISQVINFHTTPDSYIVMFLIRLAAYPLLEGFMWKKLRAPYREVQRQTKKGWWLFTAIAAIFYVSITLFMNNPTPITERQEYYPVMLLVFILMPLVYMHIIMTLLHQHREYEESEQEDILKLQSANLVSRVSELAEANDKFREERHNFRHKLRTIAMLVDRKQYEELEFVLKEYTQTFKSTQVTRYCENAVIDAVLSHYIRQAESLGIKLELGFDFPEEIPVDTTELATVFANAIENAIHACEKLPAAERWIEIKVISKPKFIARIKNKYNGKVEFDGEGIPVNREEGHGFGTRSIVAFCNKIGGHYNFNANGEYFTVILNF